MSLEFLYSHLFPSPSQVRRVSPKGPIRLCFSKLLEIPVFCLDAEDLSEPASLRICKSRSIAGSGKPHVITSETRSQTHTADMAPIQPHWQRPSHPGIQEVIINEAEFTSKSLSKVSVPPFGLYAKLAFPPCTIAEAPTYATVQMGRDSHLNLNSDLLYINHSCEPSLVSLT